MEQPFNNQVKNTGSDNLARSTQSNGKGSNFSSIQTPKIDLPKGGGALKNIDEKFSVNAVNGTAAFSVPLSFSATRSGFVPSISLNYNSGSGNSVFGLGWSLDFACIQRRTDKRLPEYKDNEESDIFTLSGLEDLVPFLIKDNSGHLIIQEFTDPLTGFGIRRYRPRIENGFSRIERISPNDRNAFYWRVTSPDNIVTIYGRSEVARVTNPSNSNQIYKWLPELSYDDKGNCFEMEYVHEDLKNIPSILPEGNRLNGNAQFTNTYLKRIHYGNKIPYYVDSSLSYNPPPPINPQYFFAAVIDYGDHNDAIPTSVVQNDWPCRLEPFSTYKSAFEIRTYRLCKRVLFFHYFNELNHGQETLVRSLDFSYRYFNNPMATKDELRNTEVDFIIAVSQSGYIKNIAVGYDKKSMPPIEFSYQEFGWNKTIREISPENIINAPIGLGNNYQWVDLWSEGISGILSEQAEAWFYKSNLGEGNFSLAVPVIPKPSLNGLSNGNLQLQDLDADGRKFIVSSQGTLKGYFEISDDDEWQPFISFPAMPNISFNDANVKFIDLNGDGRVDLVMSEENVFLWYPSLGTEGFGDPELAAKSFDEEKGPAIVFADSTQSIYLADMSGDGLTDLVRIRNGEINYWPNTGFGNFGAKVNMNDAPVFDVPELFNPAYLHLSDINGTGSTDIIYLGNNQYNAWINLSGNGWSETLSIDPFPDTAVPNQLSVVDLLGNGTACIVWSSPLPRNVDSPMRYIDLMGGNKPYIMSGYKNNFGKEQSWDYKSSSYFYLQDKKSGKPWVTKLPFPVQCVVNLKINDLVAGSYFSSAYTYHHGYYDHPEREYRGFGRVEQTDTEQFTQFVLSGASNVVEEDLFQSPVKTITWFHTGAYFNNQKILNQFAHEYNIGPYEFDLPEPALPESLTADECREALRACKGMVLRQEVYGLEDSPSQVIPYSSVKHNNLIRILQPRAINPYAVFYSHESEAASFYYERNLNDPRISHNLNLEVTNFGFVLKSGSIVYGRKTTDPLLPSDIQAEQSAVNVVITENVLTKNPASADENVYFNLPDVYRLNAVSETKTYELTNSVYNSKSQFAIAELLSDYTTAIEIKYEDSPTGSLEKRLIENMRVVFLGNDIITPMPLGQMESLAMVYQTYKLALTPSLVTTLYGSRVTSTMLLSAAYNQQDATNWWISSGTHVYLDTGETVTNARSRFYLPVGVLDPFQNKTSFFYDDYFLIIVKTTDALLNSASVETIDYRRLQPVKMNDLNGNTSEIISDALGMIIASSVYGEEADGLHGEIPLSAYTLLPPLNLDEVISDPQKFLQQATTFFYYDLFAWINRSQPVCFASIVRETHESELSGGIPTKVFLSVGYSDGLGKNLQTKVQAEPGEALQWLGNTLITVDTTPNLRWVGNGRTILNNKGNPVKQFEPFFSTTFDYESDSALVEIGFSSVLYYDPLSRNIRVEHANGTLSRTEFDAWKQLVYDENDTVLESQWYADPDQGSPNPLGPEPVDKEQRAAWLAVKNANTPTQQHFDSLGRTIYTIADNGAAGKYATRAVLDIENNQRQVIDARGNVVMQYDYDMISRQVHQVSMDGGERFVFTDALNKPVYAWDSRNHRFHSEYDSLHRPANQWLVEDITKSMIEKLIGVVIYGENQPNDTVLNLRGKAFQSYDQSGLVQTSEYDFKGNVKTSFKQIASGYKEITDWNIVNKTTLLDISRTFTTSSKFDAVNSPVEMVLPDSSKVSPVYNEANLLRQLNVFIQSQNKTVAFVQNIDYNAKAQREKILYGNNTSTGYTYDERNYRLTRLLSTRNNGADIMQDLNYTYDPVGNITDIVDAAQPNIYFNNAGVDPSNKYMYDAIYRLIYAQGREHAGQNAACDQFDTDKTQDRSGNRLVLPGDMNAMQRYEQQYEYDEVGNMLQMIHNAGNGAFSNKWTRVFTCNMNNNQLIKTQVGATVINYSYDAHGNMQNLQNGGFNLTWNYADQLQQVDLGGGGIAYYVYDAGGQRVRKVIENGNLVKDRIYLSAYELYRESQNGSPKLERETLHIMDDKNRIALIETRTQGNDNGLPFLIRYQYSNHLGTASLELDETASIISYEEYYPFGSTSYQAMDNQTETPKRYRYTGKERDYESGLYYHGARYYAPWLVRWISADPIGISDGLNVYRYVSDNPIRLIDLDGLQKYDGDASGTSSYSNVSNPKNRISVNGKTWFSSSRSHGEESFFGGEITAKFRAPKAAAPSNVNETIGEPALTKEIVRQRREEDWSAAKAGMRNEAIDTLGPLISAQLSPVPLPRYNFLEGLKVESPTTANTELRRYELKDNYETGRMIFKVVINALSFVPVADIAEGASLVARKLPVPAGGLGVIGGQGFQSAYEADALKEGLRFHEHHVFPKEFESEFKELLKGTGKDVHDYTIRLEVEKHINVHRSGLFNWEWEQFFMQPRSKRTLKAAQELSIDLHSELGVTFDESTMFRRWKFAPPK